ncbi:DNA starvation/stationary phase protection protein [Streptomyces tendae]|uniref:Dps family protein n=1 Tax=Streptomyces tendae TaxID=1932 RepID=UPI00167AF21B|nr:DNA starvation/stationary phase protection protein [Streptomyces tendae]GHB13844.1 DNA starvation/stationary phase protection protein [Streptomyces tendae]
MSVIRSSLSPGDRQVTGDALQGTLVDLLDLSLLAKQAHWNLYGPRFRSIHQQLDEVVATARDCADQVAERAAALGVSPDGLAATVAKTSGLPAFPPGPVPDTDVVGALVVALSTLIARMRDRIRETGASDEVSQDLLISLTGALEKQHWMFQAENSV